MCVRAVVRPELSCVWCYGIKSNISKSSVFVPCTPLSELILPIKCIQLNFEASWYENLEEVKWKVFYFKGVSQLFVLRLFYPYLQCT